MMSIDDAITLGEKIGFAWGLVVAFGLSAVVFFFFWYHEIKE